jgi:Zn ribbon nucleic-acid-binding protein
MIEEAVRFIAEMAKCPRCGSKDLNIEKKHYLSNLLRTNLTIECMSCGYEYKLSFTDEALWDVEEYLNFNIKGEKK